MLGGGVLRGFVFVVFLLGWVALCCVVLCVVLRSCFGVVSNEVRCVVRGCVVPCRVALCGMLLSYLAVQDVVVCCDVLCWIVSWCVVWCRVLLGCVVLCGVLMCCVV